MRVSGCVRETKIMKKLKKYRVTGHVFAGKYLGIVEAENEEDAKEKGLNLETASVSLCHACAEECEDPQVEDVTVEEIED